MLFRPGDQSFGEKIGRWLTAVWNSSLAVLLGLFGSLHSLARRGELRGLCLAGVPIVALFRVHRRVPSFHFLGTGLSPVRGVEGGALQFWVPNDVIGEKGHPSEPTNPSRK